MKILKILSISLILIGFTIIIIAIALKYTTIINQDKLLKNYEEKIKNTLNNKNSTNINNDANTAIYNEESSTSPSNSTTENIKSYNVNSGNDNEIDLSNVIGILNIDKINLKVCISEGVEMETLKYAVGHFKETVLPGQLGNFAIAGHRSYAFGEYFNRLDELENGDKISILTTNGTYFYTVVDKKIVLPEQVEVLNPTDDATLTLITCTPIRSATHRLIISAKLDI